MGAYFGIGEAEDLYVWECADMALVAPLPPGWSEEQGAGGGEGGGELRFKCAGGAAERLARPSRLWLGCVLGAFADGHPPARSGRASAHTRLTWTSPAKGSSEAAVLF